MTSSPVSPVLCCQGCIWSPVFYILGVYIRHQGGQGGAWQQWRQLSYGCTQATQEKIMRRIYLCCFVNIHGPEYFVSQMTLSLPHLVVYIDIEWSENVDTHRTQIVSVHAYAYIWQTLATHCFGNVPSPVCPTLVWSVTPYITGKLQHYHYLSTHLGPVSSDQH